MIVRSRPLLYKNNYVENKKMSEFVRFNKKRRVELASFTCSSVKSLQHCLL